MVTAAQFIDYQLGLAASHVGVREVGNNAGPEVEHWQKAVDGKARNESWCMGVQQDDVKDTETALCVKLTKLRRSEHCLTVLQHGIKHGYGWLMTDPKRPKIQKGDWLIFSHGIVPWHDPVEVCRTPGHVAITPDEERAMMVTYEGNTSSGDKGSQSNGDGYWKKMRPLKGPVNKFHLEGIVRPTMAGMIEVPGVGQKAAGLA